MSEVRLGLLGGGRIVQLVHLNALAQLERAKLVAVAEPNPKCQEHIRTFAPNVDVVSDYATLLGRSDIDAVVNCLPSVLHAQSAIAAFQQGKHVYLEKPIATELDDAEAVLESWRRSRKLGMIGFNNRFHPLYQQTKQLLQSDQLGRLIAVRISWCSTARELPPWKRCRNSGGGVLLVLGSHLFDIVHFLFDQPISHVRATIRSVHNEEDNAQVELELANGLPIQAILSSTTVQENCVEIFGDQGKLVLDRRRDKLMLHFPQHGHSLLDRLSRGMTVLSEATGDFIKQIKPRIEPSYGLAFQAFVSAIHDKQLLQKDGNLEDGYRSLAVVHAAEESARTQSVVHLPGEILSK